MRGKTILSIIGLAAGVTLALALLLVTGGTTGEYHAGGTLLCYDCHTIHFSMQHNWDGTTPVPTTPQSGGNWLSNNGPNEFLLKDTANNLCLGCHDGQTFAPDVLGVNTNASPANGREAGALNEAALGAPYDTWKGHTLGSTDMPPGYNPAVLGNLYTYSPGSEGLECTDCHTQHGQATAYRNLGPRALGSGNLPTYKLGTTNDTTKDVWINIATPYTAGSGNAATFNPYYATANISFNRNDATLGTTNSSNKVDTMCAACHGNFHGSPGDTNIGGNSGAGNLEGFLRHPTSKAVIGAAGGAGYGGHSTLSRYTSATTKVKVYSSTSAAGYTDASPGCVTCHKGHGNQNPFGLIFLNRSAASVDEQGGYATGQTADVPTGYRNLCGQCHSQGN
jgi:hypothetical protein